MFSTHSNETAHVTQRSLFTAIVETQSYITKLKTMGIFNIIKTFIRNAVRENIYLGAKHTAIPYSRLKHIILRFRN